MATARGTIRFWPRTDKPLRDGTVPLFLIYSIQGQRRYYNTGLKLYQEQWDEENQRIEPLSAKLAKAQYGLRIQDLPTKEALILRNPAKLTTYDRRKLTTIFAGEEFEILLAELVNKSCFFYRLKKMG